MSAREDKMAREMAERTQPITAKIAELDANIDKAATRISEMLAAKQALQEVLAVMTGTPVANPVQERKPRATNVKGVVLDIMANAGAAGRTSAEVVLEAAERIPGIARDTVSSVLSRLKGAEALVYDGLRYYDSRYAPRPGDVAVSHIRAV